MTTTTGGPDAAWTWAFDDGDGHGVVPPGEDTTPPAGGFSARADAESWVGERWRALVAAGAETAHLRHGDQVVGRPLALRPTA